jgi:2-phospho-L-lactate guanylyltransferase
VRTFAILPVKSFGVAKQRLRDGLDPATREALVEAMFTDVLDALVLAGLDAIVVVTASPAARRIASERGATVLVDRETGHNAAAEVGLGAALQARADRALLVPGDCPALSPDELRHLLDLPIVSPSVLVVPDRHGTGTNALLLTPPDALGPSFGPGSCRRHVALAEAAGVTVEVVEVPTLAIDVDTPDDLDALADEEDLAPSTRRLLARC